MQLHSSLACRCITALMNVNDAYAQSRSVALNLVHHAACCLIVEKRIYNVHRLAAAVKQRTVTYSVTNSVIHHPICHFHVMLPESDRVQLCMHWRICSDSYYPVSRPQMVLDSAVRIARNSGASGGCISLDLLPLILWLQQ